MLGQRIKSTELAGLQYAGISGATASCLRAIAHAIQGPTEIKSAWLISSQAYHAFILFDSFDDLIVIKDGFSSGYSGEGPSGLSTALALLDRHQIDIEEYEVSEEVLHRLGMSCLSQKDINGLRSSRPVRPTRWYSYLLGTDIFPEKRRARTRGHYLHTIPFRLVDDRIFDLALRFSTDADGAVFNAFRRLEQIVRDRGGLASESGVKLFSRAFLSEDAPLGWDLPDEAEAKGRANLFVATYMAYRNPRAHREQEQSTDEQLREFLLVNELFHLESCAVKKVPPVLPSDPKAKRKAG